MFRVAQRQRIVPLVGERRGSGLRHRSSRVDTDWQRQMAVHTLAEAVLATRVTPAQHEVLAQAAAHAQWWDDGSPTGVTGFFCRSVLAYFVGSTERQVDDDVRDVLDELFSRRPVEPLS